ncbi:MAG: hypothetical protein ABEJ40_11550 [Haloarculaceae archaeon]
MTGNTLQFVHSARPPATDVRVFDSLTRSFLGAEFTFRVVGSSHYVSAPAYDFHELSSCEPVRGDDVATIRLDGDRTSPSSPPSSPSPSRSRSPEEASDASAPPARRLSYEADAVRCETVVERRPLAAFPDDASFDLSYRFGEDAVTTVDVGTDGYETYHTYPEFDLALYTRTVFTSVPGAAAEDRPAAERSERVPERGDGPATVSTD